MDIVVLMATGFFTEKEREEISARIVDLTKRGEKTIRAADIARFCDVSPPMAGNWLKGVSAPQNMNAVNLAKMLGCSVDYLHYGTVEVDGDSPLNTESEAGRQSSEVSVILYDDIESALGGVRPHEHRVTTFSNSELNQEGVDAADILHFRASGNSMAPEMPHGSALAVDTKHRAVRDGNDYVIEKCGSYFVRKLVTVVGGYKAIAYNLDYEDESIDLAEWQIIGRVFWSSKFR